MLSAKDKYKRLIIRLIQGEATAEEQQKAQVWISKSPENERLYQSYKGLLILTDRKETSFDADRAWEKFSRRIHTERKPAPEKVPVRPIYGKKVLAVIGSLAAMLLIALGLFSILQKEPGLKEYATINSTSDNYKLPDGSFVVLNRDTRVIFPGVFSGGVREISIFGEAFFEITHDPGKPFIVHASGLDIRVMGTSFNVYAPEGNDFVKVTVNTGRVMVYPSETLPENAETAGISLNAGETATYSRQTGRISKGVSDDLNVLSWKTGVLTFREARLADVLKALEIKYETRFIVDNPVVLNQRLTARFENNSLDNVLETLTLIFNLRFEKNNGQILVR